MKRTQNTRYDIAELSQRTQKIMTLTFHNVFHIKHSQPHTILYETRHYLIEVMENTLFLSLVTAVFWAAFFCSSSVKHFQIRSVSSAPADTTV